MDHKNRNVVESAIEDCDWEELKKIAHKLSQLQHGSALHLVLRCSRGIIPKDAVSSLVTTENISMQNEDGDTPLHIAAERR